MSTMVAFSVAVALGWTWISVTAARLSTEPLAVRKHR